MIRFIFNMVLYTVASLVMVFVGFPATRESVKKINTEVYENQELLELKVARFQNLDNVFIVHFRAKDTILEKQLNTTNDSFKNLSMFFKSEIKDSQDIFNKEMPLILSQEQLDYPTISYKISKNKENVKFLSHLMLNDTTIIGSSGKNKKLLISFIGYFMLVMGGICSIILPISTIFQIRNNHKYGTALNTPDRAKGLQYFRDIFK